MPTQKLSNAVIYVENYRKLQTWYSSDDNCEVYIEWEDCIEYYEQNENLCSWIIHIYRQALRTKCLRRVDGPLTSVRQFLILSLDFWYLIFVLTSAYQGYYSEYNLCYSLSNIHQSSSQQETWNIDYCSIFRQTLILINCLSRLKNSGAIYIA